MKEGFYERWWKTVVVVLVPSNGPGPGKNFFYEVRYPENADLLRDSSRNLSDSFLMF